MFEQVLEAANLRLAPMISGRYRLERDIEGAGRGSRYVPVLDARFNYKGQDDAEILKCICRQTGYPKTIRVDDGSKFVSRDMDLWARFRR